MASVHKSLSDEGSFTGVGNVWAIFLGKVVEHRSNTVIGKVRIPRGYSSDSIRWKCCNGVTLLWSVRRCWKALLSKEEGKLAVAEDNDDDYSSQEEAQNADNNQMVRLYAGLCLRKIHTRIEVVKFLVEVEKFGFSERLVSWKLSIILEVIQREVITKKNTNHWHSNDCRNDFHKQFLVCQFQGTLHWIDFLSSLRYQPVFWANPSIISFSTSNLCRRWRCTRWEATNTTRNLFGKEEGNCRILSLERFGASNDFPRYKNCCLLWTITDKLICCF